MGSKIKLEKIKDNKNIKSISYEEKFKPLSIISNVINGQLLSLNIAKRMDKRRTLG